ncbi:YwhD family protein [Bacillus tianshenii]|nr:YwhD family protein [Bacillus tianshenii]
MSEKKKMGFNILKNDPTDGHGGYGTGALSLENVSPVIVDVENEEAYVDMGALHARSAVEKRIKFSAKKEDVPNGKLVWLVWVTVGGNEQGPAYSGIGACEMLIDAEARRGYKLLPEHVNNMDKALKGKVVMDKMDEKSKEILRDFLITFKDGAIWNNSSDEVKNAFPS